MLAPEHPAYGLVHRRPPLRRRRVLAGLLAALVLLPADAVLPHVAADRAVAAQVRAVLPGLQAFVERERGLTFRRPVQVVLLDREAFLAASGDARAAEADDDTGATMQGLGQLSLDEDLDDLVDGALDEGVEGFYEVASTGSSCAAPVPTRTPGRCSSTS